jgi:hypothetical protein
MQRLSEFTPYTIAGSIEAKVEIGIGVERVPDYWRREGVERINERTYIFRGKDIVHAWLKWTDFQACLSAIVTRPLPAVHPA